MVTNNPQNLIAYNNQGLLGKPGKSISIMGQQDSALCSLLRDPATTIANITHCHGRRMERDHGGGGVSCPAVKHLGLEVTHITSAHNSLVKASQLVTLKHSGLKKSNHAMCLEGRESRVFGE